MARRGTVERVAGRAGPVERLSAEDQLMLWPDEAWPQDLGGIALLDGADLLDPDGGFRIETVRAAVASRLHLVPRFRQVLVTPRRGLGPPLWADATAFDVAEHVRALPIPAPGDEAQLLAEVERIRRRRLDRTRPLWEMWFLTGLVGNRVGLFVRMHHCIADGIAATQTIGVFLDADPATPLSPPPPWRPAPPPTARELAADNLRRHGAALGRTLVALARPATTVRHLRAAVPTARELLADARPPVPGLDRRVGSGRVLVLVRADLGAVLAVAHAHGATVNDVILSALAGGLRRLLEHRGAPVDGVTAAVYVPVTLRRGGGGAALPARGGPPAAPASPASGNLITQMVVPLPVGEADPARRLRQIAAVTAARKARTRPPLGALFGSRLLLPVLLRLIDRQSVNVTTADLRGPPAPVHLAGARVLEVFPVLPLIGKVALGVGALSYDGRLELTVVADGDVYPDLTVLAAGLEEELLRTARGSRSPAR